MKSTFATGLTLAALLLGSAAVAHPLDGLTGDEIRKAGEILRGAGEADDKTLYPLIELKEPPMDQVLAWKEGDSLDRRVIVDYATPEGFKRATVNLTSGEVEDTFGVGTSHEAFVDGKLVDAEALAELRALVGRLAATPVA